MRFYTIVVALSLCCMAGAVRLRGLRTPTTLEDTPVPGDEWFTQKLDHSDPTNLKTWQQRYFTNASFFMDPENAPVFLQIGGEGEASPLWMVKGAWIEYAQSFGALCFQLEHRFYGKSHPLSDMSIGNLRYLSSEQALADLAYFIQGMTEKYSLTSKNKWIVFGGSYPGSLAAWARFKYPHLIHGAMSASGPLYAKSNFSEYFDVVSDSLATFSTQCTDAVRQSFDLFGQAVTQNTPDIIKQFKICEQDFNPSKTDDLYTLVENLSNMFADVVQYNKDNKFVVGPLSSVTIEDLCAVMTDTTVGDPLARLAKLNTKILDISKEKCINSSYSEMISEMQTVDWDSEAGVGGRQWTYQTCTEFGWYQTSSSITELMGPYMPLDWYIKQCADIFGDKFNQDLLNAGMERTNNNYGQFNIQVNRVVFVHGSIDPWHALGIYRTKNFEAPAIFIKGTAHCANMYPSSPNDLPELTSARRTIVKLIKLWLSEEP